MIDQVDQAILIDDDLVGQRNLGAVEDQVFKLTEKLLEANGKSLLQCRPEPRGQAFT
ncbi:MAG: hypothetical protein ACLGIN_02300 [Candidatus Sericytochromatia bacterium]